MAPAEEVIGPVWNKIPTHEFLGNISALYNKALDSEKIYDTIIPHSRKFTFITCWWQNWRSLLNEKWNVLKKLVVQVQSFYNTACRITLVIFYILLTATHVVEIQDFMTWQTAMKVDPSLLANSTIHLIRSISARLLILRTYGWYLFDHCLPLMFCYKVTKTNDFANSKNNMYRRNHKACMKLWNDVEAMENKMERRPHH